MTHSTHGHSKNVDVEILIFHVIRGYSKRKELLPPFKSTVKPV